MDLLVLVIGSGPAASGIAANLRAALEDRVPVAEAADVSHALRIVDADPGAAVPLVVLCGDGCDLDATMRELYADDQLAEARTFVTTTRAEHRDLAEAIDRGWLHTLVMHPPPPGLLEWMVTSQLASWMADRGLDPVPTLVIPEQGSEPSELFQLLEASNEELTEGIMRGIDGALTRRPRLVLPPGVRLTRQGEDVDGVFIVISGKVALTRATPSENLLLHHASTGPVVGLLSLARQQKAFFTSTTTTEVEAVHLSTDQLNRALILDPGVAAGLTAGAIRGLTLRLLRSEELQVERNELNAKLKKEQRRLAKALSALEAARMELIQQAKFATLGELAAGVAHELNNPVAALTGAAASLAEEAGRLVASHPQGRLLGEVLEAARTRPGLSTAQERQVRRELERLTGDPALAWRLVAAGITDPSLAANVDVKQLDMVESAAMLGTAAHNIEVASERIAELVTSLRSYARPESEAMDGVDLNAGIEDTLRLVAHRLRGIDIVRDYGEIPPVRAHPSRLGQVWTNLIVNAADALAGEGRLEISTRLEGETAVVDIIDNGPGIDPAVLPRIFEPRFTTKHGTVRYGLGLGLGLAKRLVEEHGGTVTADSQPGQTIMTVTLPVSGPPKE